MFFVLFNTVNNSLFIQISSNIVKVCPADEALCLVRLSSFVLEMLFHKPFGGSLE